MHFNRLIGSKMLISAAVISGLALGTFCVSHTLANSTTNSNSIYKTNKSGQTYGSDMNCTSIGQEPDLIQAIGSDGTEGYVLSKDLNGDMPKSPEEALALQGKAPQTRKIPLYDAEGKTVIGEFEIGGGTTIYGTSNNTN